MDSERQKTCKYCGSEEHTSGPWWDCPEQRATAGGGWHWSHRQGAGISPRQQELRDRAATDPFGV